MSKVLIETRLNSLKLNESHAPRKGCLGRIEGICADYANPTRNGRFYSRELWEHVFNDDLIKESLESKTLIGELDHPEDRFEPLAKEACVVMTDYRFDDDKKVVYGGFDILDTPSGKILKALLDYGCVMGVSSRGQGDITSNGEYEDVAPDTYEFACFDVVTTPAVASARQHVTESAKSKHKLKGLNASIIEQVNNSTTNAELDTILRVVESTGLSNLASIKEAVRNKRKSISEGKTISDKIRTDLHEAKKQIKQLTKQIEESQAKTINEKNKFNTTTSNLTSQVLAYKHRENKLIDTIESLQLKLSESLDQINDLESKLNEQISVNKNSESVIESMKNSVNESMTKYDLVLSNEQKLRSQLKEANDKVKSLSNDLADKNSKISSLSESVDNLKKENKELNSSRRKSLNESSQRIDKQGKLLESFKTKYVESVCNQYGLDAKDIKESIANKSVTVESIDKQIKECADKRDRYKNLPFTESKPTGFSVLSESVKNVDDIEDAELAESRRFMESVGKAIYNN